MGAGRTRNEKCWCASGLKFKHCHWRREEAAPVKTWEAENSLKRAFQVPVCSAPESWHKDCTGGIVRAHTVPRSSSLNRIAREGHVYAFIPTIANLSKHNGRLVPQLVGVRKASTFTGFCSRHDAAIFAPLERESFSATPEQCFLLGYRALARECYTKESSARLSPLRQSADRGRDIRSQVELQVVNKMFEEGLQAGLADTRAEKAAYDARLLGHDFADVRAYVIETREPPPVMCSAAWLPSSDFAGEPLQDLMMPGRPAAMSFTSFWGGASGAVVFQWVVQDEDVCGRFIASLEAIDDSALSSALVRLMFEHFENVHISPDWWEALPNAHRDALINRMSRSANPLLLQLPKPLADDGLNIGAWEILRRYRRD